MIPRPLTASLALALAALGLAAAPQSARGQSKKADPPPSAPLIKLARQAAKEPRALRYRLLPDPLDLVPGNAAPLWVRAGQAARENKRQITDKEYEWTDRDKTPLKDLPRKEVRALLGRHAAVLRTADQAARRTRCDWEHPPLTFQDFQDVLFLKDAQNMRLLAQLLTLRCRLELSEGHFDRAVHTLQTGMALARDIGLGDTLIENLVGIAVEAIMLARVEEWIQIPGSPNLYWPLTVLPRPLVDTRRSIRTELNTIYRSFPQLRELQKKRMTERQVQDLVGDLVATLQKTGEEVPSWLKQFGLAALVARNYPGAKKYLIAQGRPEKEVEAMPALQVVVVRFLDQYDHMRDDIIKWFSVPPWQGIPALERVDREYRAVWKKEGNFILGLLLPAVVKVYQAQVRTERQIAGLRCAEALRRYAAGHDGKPPAKLGDITVVPLPLDPSTGKGFDDFYKTQDGRGVLDVPPPPFAANQPSLGRRYELAPGR